MPITRFALSIVWVIDVISSAKIYIHTYEQDYSAGIWMAIYYEELFDSAMPYDDFVPTEGRSALQNCACPKIVPQLPAAVWRASLID